MIETLNGNSELLKDIDNGQDQSQIRFDSP